MKPPFVNVKIVSTLGPASLNLDFLHKTAQYRQLYFRLNASHLTPGQISEYQNFISQGLSNNPAEYYLDLPGKKMRIDKLAHDLHLREDEKINIVKSNTLDSNTIILKHDVFFRQIEPDDMILLQDAQIQLKVIGISKNVVETRIVQGGILRSRAGIMIQNKTSTLQDHLPDQLDYLQIAKNLDFKYLALSFITSDDDLIQLRKSCTQLAYFPKIIAKIEHSAALQNLNSILREADEIWYCRGDLGSFVSPWDLLEWQGKTIQESRLLEKPVYIAGQVFQYLTEHPYPTRTEVIHFLQLIQEGVQGIVLSDETAIGKNSIRAVEAIFSLL
jgi:pyruvate kinase